MFTYFHASGDLFFSVIKLPFKNPKLINCNAPLNILSWLLSFMMWVGGAMGGGAMTSYTIIASSSERVWHLCHCDLRPAKLASDREPDLVFEISSQSQTHPDRHPLNSWIIRMTRQFVRRCAEIMSHVHYWKSEAPGRKRLTKHQMFSTRETSISFAFKLSLESTLLFLFGLSLNGDTDTIIGGLSDYCETVEF